MASTDTSALSSPSSLSSSSSATDSYNESERQQGRRRRQGGSRRSSKGQSKSAIVPITTIPDMRFEQSYLASVRGFIHEHTEQGKADEIERAHIAEEQEQENEKRRHGDGPSSGDGQGTDALAKETGVPAEALTKETGVPAETKDDTERHVHSVVATRSPRTGEPELWLGNLRIEWWSIVYLTVRDQLLSPIVQGAVFGLGGLALSHVRTFLGMRRQMRQQQSAQAAPFPTLRGRR